MALSINKFGLHRAFSIFIFLPNSPRQAIDGAAGYRMRRWNSRPAANMALHNIVHVRTHSASFLRTLFRELSARVRFLATKRSASSCQLPYVAAVANIFTSVRALRLHTCFNLDVTFRGILTRGRLETHTCSVARARNMHAHMPGRAFRARNLSRVLGTVCICKLVI